MSLLAVSIVEYNTDIFGKSHIETPLKSIDECSVKYLLIQSLITNNFQNMNFKLVVDGPAIRLSQRNDKAKALSIDINSFYSGTENKKSSERKSKNVDFSIEINPGILHIEDKDMVSVQLKLPLIRYAISSIDEKFEKRGFSNILVSFFVFVINVYFLFR